MEVQTVVEIQRVLQQALKSDGAIIDVLRQLIDTVVMLEDRISRQDTIITELKIQLRHLDMDVQTRIQ